MLHKYTVDEVSALVPARFVRKLTTRPKKSKPVVNGVVAPPPTDKKIERFLSHHRNSRRNPRALTVDRADFTPNHLFPFATFYSPKGVFERKKAVECLDFMLSKNNDSASHLVVQLYIESLWCNDANWKELLKGKMAHFKINNFRAPRAILSAIESNRLAMAQELIAYSDPGGLKDVAGALVETKNTTYLEKIIPLLNISNRNDVLFQGLSRLSRFEQYGHLWEFMAAWANPYKVASKMLYMRECPPADFLLSREYVPIETAREAWRYVEKAGLEDYMPLTAARLLHERLEQQLAEAFPCPINQDRPRRKI